MKTKTIWGNLPVKDVERTKKFFLELGFKFNGGNNELCSFIIAENAFIINFIGEEKFKKEASYSELTDTKKSAEICFSLSAESKQEVNEWAAKVRSLGGTVLLEPQDIPGNMYNTVFADLDGHRWNVLYC
ncbi:glyoxalase [Chitinophaga sp. SYP-B3965]|uniref:VOC family protein n=1 Tax=Chitinophaga sp. SYP-B3965 TaxID=2663120 RepID=UPI001299AF38|nr:VOC family protein [Chitinophaga sp. SYP-B3965]MRG45037.1 glyoxalase [Chitinophaga sp. SYP-B3965]